LPQPVDVNQRRMPMCCLSFNGAGRATAHAAVFVADISLANSSHNDAQDLKRPSIHVHRLPR
jgi:hypothetical protein